jgi:hypothetical protein
VAKQRIDRSFVSELDQFIQQFDQQHPEKSKSQIADIKKAARVAQLRDHAISTTAAEQKIWEEFNK